MKFPSFVNFQKKIKEIIKILSRFWFFTSCPHPPFLFGLHFLLSYLMFHYIHTLIMFKHVNFDIWMHTSKMKKKKHIHYKISSRDEVFTRLFFFFSSQRVSTREISFRDEIIPVYGKMSLTVYTFLPRWNFIPGWKKDKKDV